MSTDEDNSKIALAGSSKRSVKEAYARAKQWLRRRRKRGSAPSAATPTSKQHLPVVEDTDSAAEMSSEDQSADDTDTNTNPTDLYVDSNAQSDA